MLTNNYEQRRILLNKAGLGVPQAARVTTNMKQPTQTTQASQPQPKAPNPAPTAPKKPGCGACSRKKK